ncbi:DNA recombination protein RmuC [Ramlibacter sp. AN1015]|uniref:DNA recombination protein RmuC n=1 Tax=Ramlibacter sp. AN1015 TaxID=3133428 RepID=UPI0030BBA086
METIIEVAFALAGLSCGALLTTVFFRGRIAALLEAAVAQGRAALDIELAAQGARLRAAEAELQESRHDAQLVREAGEIWRSALEDARGELARVSERASRVTAIDADLHRLTLQLRLNEEELRRLAASEAHKDEALQGARARLERLEAENAALHGKLESAMGLLQHADQRRATAQEQAARARGLEAQLHESQLRCATAEERLMQLRSAASIENGRLAADLAACRETADHLRGELAAARGLQIAAEAQVGHLAREAAELRARAERAVLASRPLSARRGTALPAAAVPGTRETAAPDLLRLASAPAQRLALADMIAAAGLSEPVHCQPEGDAAALIHLPQGRRLRLDAALSLQAFQGVRDAGDEDARAQALGAHVAAIRSHADRLAQARQQAGPDAAAELVVLLVPDEAAFVLAVTADGGLPLEGWRHGVLLAGPSGLVFVLRTVAQLWRQEARHHHGPALAEHGARLAARAAELNDDLDALGDTLAEARATLEAVHARLGAQEDGLVAVSRAVVQVGMAPASR